MKGKRRIELIHFFVHLDEILAGWKIKCGLTEKILAYFKNFQRANTNADDLLNPDLNSKLLGKGERLKAKCKLCDDRAPYKFFIKGNNSNLKTHLIKVLHLLPLLFVDIFINKIMFFLSNMIKKGA